MFAYYKPFLILIFLSFSLAACRASATPTPDLPTAPAPAQTLTPQPQTATPSATPTQLPPTLSPTPAPSLTATPLPTPTLDPLLAQARLLGVSWQPGYNLLLSIQFPEPVKAEDVKVMIEEEELYQCQVLSQFPKRLYCIGRGRNVYDQMNVQIFSAGAAIPGYEGRIYVPYFTETFTR